jgi:hypothetical protein
MRPASLRRVAPLLVSIVVAVAAGACGGSSGGLVQVPPATTGQPPPGPLPIAIGPYDPLPGVVLAAVGVSGGTGPGGNFRPGDFVTVQFTLETNAGEALDLTLMNAGAIYLSGPTTNYNRVIPSQSNLRSASLYLGNATWQYTFPVPLPATYAAPVNDSPSFGVDEGELTGQALLDGTYSIGIEVSTLYTVDFEDLRDAGSLVVDVLVGGAASVTPREVTTAAHCNQCHTEIVAHGGRRKGVELCLLCHTSGAEDRNDPAVEGGTPGVSVDFRVMIHKIHNGKHLPSVLGVGTRTDGSGARDYGVAPKPYRLVGFSTFDASHIGFPVFPSLSIAMPQDAGYAALTPSQKAQEDEIRKGVVACAKCHGDPDGGGPIQAPLQGDLHETQPTRHACGSCHDDIDWSQPYAANNDVMIADPPVCTTCHPAATTGAGLYPVRQGHLHPLLDKTFNPGLFFSVSAVSEAGTNDGDGTLDPGEKVQVTMTCVDDAGMPVPPSTVSSINAVVSGPTSNYNLVLNTAVPVTHPGLAGAGPVYAFLLPEAVVLEWVGTNTAGAGDAFPTTRSPHLNLAAAPTRVYTRGTNPVGGGNSVSTADLEPRQNFIDVAFVAGFSGQVAAPAVVEYVCVDDGLPTREYVQVKWVQGNRLWLNSPLRLGHGAGASVVEVALTTRTVGTHYTLDAPNGVVNEVGVAFGTGGDVLVDYWSDFLLPSDYPPPLNDSPDLGESFGEWKGKPLADGTYTLDLYGVINRNLVLYGQTNAYRGASEAGLFDFLVGAAATVQPYAVISEAANCYVCHDDLWFHGGGRRSFGTCIVCHGDAGGEDRARYTSPNGPDTPGVSIAFREMLHKIHMGKELTNAATYVVAGNNGSSNLYDEVGFPALPGGVRQCVKCHGNDAWHEPANRDHPTSQGAPVRSWRVVCGSCHDSTAAHAHIDAQTSPSGHESCAVCHGSLRDADVVKVHFPR